MIADQCATVIHGLQHTPTKCVGVTQGHMAGSASWLFHPTNNKVSVAIHVGLTLSQIGDSQESFHSLVVI